jgi:cobalamin biosynthesis protein CobT
VLTQAPEVMRYIRASAGRAGLGVVWEEENRPRHDGKNIYLPRMTAKTTQEDIILFMSSVDHEVAHDKFSSFKVIQDNKILLSNQLLMFVWNFVEDSRVNTIEASDYRGFREIWDESTSNLMKSIAEKFAKDPTKDINYLMSHLIVWEAVINKDLFPLCEETASRLFTPLDPDTVEFLESFSDRLIASHKERDKEKGSQMTLDIAIDILRIDREKVKKEEEKRKKEEEKKGTGKKGEGKEEEATKKGKKGTEEGSSKDEDIHLEDPKDKEYKIVKIKVTKEDLDNATISPVNINTSEAKVGINFDLDDSLLTSDKDWDLTGFDDFIVVNYPKNEGGREFYINDAAHYFKPGYERSIGSHVITEEGFAQQVRKLIQIRAKAQTQFGVKKGKLDQSRISRVCFKAPGLSERVFKNKIENLTLNSAVSILIDMSGSMSGLKSYHACKAGMLMNKVCTVLKIPCEVLGFTDNTVRSKSGEYDAFPIMYIYKGFNDLKVSEDNFLDYFAYSSAYMLGNPDGENILWAYDRLLKRKEKNRILIVMSDGNPAASRGGSSIIPFTAKVIKEIEQEKKVFIYGLGLLSDAVTRLYKYHSVVRSPQEIPHKLLELFEERIIKP